MGHLLLDRERLVRRKRSLAERGREDDEGEKRWGLAATPSNPYESMLEHLNPSARAPQRVVAAVLTQPSGHRPELPDQFYQNNMNGWAPTLVQRRPEITMDQASAFLASMYRANADFVFTVTRDFVRACRTPVLILPDDIPPHPYAVAMEAAMLAPNAQVSLYPWKDVPERIPLALRHIRMFLKANRP